MDEHGNSVSFFYHLVPWSVSPRRRKSIWLPCPARLRLFRDSSGSSSRRRTRQQQQTTNKKLQDTMSSSFVPEWRREKSGILYSLCISQGKTVRSTLIWVVCARDVFLLIRGGFVPGMAQRISIIEEKCWRKPLYKMMCDSSNQEWWGEDHKVPAQEDDDEEMKRMRIWTALLYQFNAKDEGRHR